MNKILGWPEPTEVGGHMVKRSNGDLSDRKAEFMCVDCRVRETGGINLFAVGIEGCKARPESLNYLSISGVPGVDTMDQATRAKLSREHWQAVASAIGLSWRMWEKLPSRTNPTLCARFTFDGKRYELRYNQPGPHGNHHIHAVKIEED
jgi:hypothetical protein